MAKASDNPFPSILLVEQDAAPATPAAGQARLYRGTDNKLYIVDDAGTAAEVGAAGGGGGGLLAVTAYNPGTQATYTAGATITDCDATNMAVTFTAPSSGSVLVRLTGIGTVTGVGDAVFWHLREGTTTVASRYVILSNSAAIDYPGAVAFLVTGLTPGSSHTYKWAHRVGNGTGGVQSKIYAGGTVGPAVMEVAAA